MPVRAFLYDATSRDREVALTSQTVVNLHDQQLLWIDVSEFEESELRHVAALLSLTVTRFMHSYRKNTGPAWTTMGPIRNLISTPSRPRKASTD